MKISDGPSPGTGSRKIWIRARSMSSVAHPVTGIAPLAPVVLFNGVSKTPIGADVAPDALTRSAANSVRTAVAGANAAVMPISPL